MPEKTTNRAPAGVAAKGRQGEPPVQKKSKGTGADRTAVAEPTTKKERTAEDASMARRATSAGALIVDREIAEAAPDGSYPAKGQLDIRATAESAGYSITKLRELYGTIDAAKRREMEHNISDEIKAAPPGKRSRDVVLEEAYACYLAAENMLRRGDGGIASGHQNRERMCLEEAIRLTDKTEFEQSAVNPDITPGETAEPTPQDKIDEAIAEKAKPVRKTVRKATVARGQTAKPAGSSRKATAKAAGTTTKKGK